MAIKEPTLFEKFLFEAPGDDPPDVAQSEATPPPDIPDDPPADDGPPDIGSDDGGAEDDSAPPDFGGGDNESDFDTSSLGDSDGNDTTQTDADLGLDEKISAIMNMNLYQRFLTLLNTIGNQLMMIKVNTDILYTLSPDSLEIVASLKKLDENIRLYLKNTFQNENYSKNLLFFNKCLNLLKLLNDKFDGNVRKGIKAM